MSPEAMCVLCESSAKTSNVYTARPHAATSLARSGSISTLLHSPYRTPDHLNVGRRLYSHSVWREHSRSRRISPQVSLDHFEVDRTLTMRVPDGEFAIMNFRCTKPFRPPFQVVASVDVSAPGKLEVFVRIGPTFPRDVTANGVTVRIPLPEEASRVHLQQMG